MFQLSNINLSENQKNLLDGLQNQLNLEQNFKEKSIKAKSLWNSKGGENGKKIFIQIKEVLLNMCVGVEVCNYCEANEANDIEHIYPKSFFPEFTFVWENYILACKQCNSGYKLDKCFVLNNEGTIYKTFRGEEPKYKTVAIINIRTEDPNKFLWLNFQTWKFEIIEELTLKDYNKADKTLEILALNQRDYLVKAREICAIEYFNTLDKLKRIIEADSKEEIETILTPYDYFDKTQTIEIIKNEIKISVFKYIKKMPHPSVWFYIKLIESKINTKWKNIFDIIPEALNW